MKTNKILICGRGYSFNYYLDKISSYNLVFAYNHLDVNPIFNFYFLSRNKEQFSGFSDKIIKESWIIDKNDSSNILIGSTTFGLYHLLSFVNNKYKGSIVDIVGFDFRVIYDDNKDEFFNNIKFIQSYIDIESQRVFSKRIKKLYKDILVRHVSFDENADIDPKSGKVISKENKNHVEIVGEITTNHFGDTERLKKLIYGAKRSGVDSIKLQMRDVDSFYSKDKLNSKFKSPFGKTFRDYRNALELSNDQINIVKQLCSELGIKYFFSVLDLISYERSKKLNQYRIKLPSTISNHKNYIEHVLKDFNKEIVISTGMTDSSFIDFLLKNFNNQSKIYLLHCISSYPVNLLKINLNVLKTYSSLGMNIIPGYSSHDIGHKGSVYSVFCGAKMIEKHIKSGNSNFAHFDETALDVDLELEEFVQEIRDAEVILGSQEKEIYDCEHHKY
jgi:sialic acid synthase SpsE